MENKKIDILCIGEALVDFIGHQPDVSLSLTKDYHRYIGGSPTNVAMNMARLGPHLAALKVSFIYCGLARPLSTEQITAKPEHHHR